MAEQAGADSITVHLREDRRHIQDHDLAEIMEVMRTHMNFEMAVTEEMLGIATQIKPSDVCLVPENRAELTTEGGLDVLSQMDKVRDACARLADADIRVSLFIDPDVAQLDAAVEVGVPVIELHTGSYAEVEGAEQEAELARVAAAAKHASDIGLVVNAGHGLHYGNVSDIARIEQIVELNIGHAIVSRAVFDGLTTAVREMKNLMLEARAAT